MEDKYPKAYKEVIEILNYVPKEKYDRQKIEEEKAEKYNPDDLFKKKKIETEENSEKTEEIKNLPIEVKKEKFYEKIINFFWRTI